MRRIDQRALLAMVAALIVAACSSGQPLLQEPDKSEDYRFQFITDPGSEAYWCEYVEMPDNAGKPVNVTGWNWSTDQFHHWALFRTTGLTTSSVDGKAFPCFGSAETKAAALASIVSQPTTTSTQIVYPEGYAIPFASKEIVMLQAHTVNPSAEATSPVLDLQVLYAPDEKPVIRLGQFQFYDPFIVVPPNGKGSASMRCAVPKAITMVYGETHTHTRGKHMRVFLDPPSGPPAATPLLEATDWEAPDSFLGKFDVAAGSSFRVFCDYEDVTGNGALQGPEKNANEMCQFYGAYAAADGQPNDVYFEACVPSFVEGGTGDMYGTGTTNCADTLTAISACPPSDAPKIGDGKFEVGACWQNSYVNSCPSASGPLNAVLKCQVAECATECAAGAGDPKCQPCVIDKCADEVTDCYTAKC